MSVVKQRGPAIMVACYTAVMLLVLGGLIVVFSNYRSGSGITYKAIFDDVSGLKAGQNVRVAGVLVGKVKKVDLRPDARVVVEFDVASSRPLDSGTHAAIKYENLIGDRYLEISDNPVPSGRRLNAGSTIPATQTTPALDLDSLVGGFKPLFQSVNADDINALTASLIGVLQGQGETVRSLLGHTSSLTATLVDQDQVIGDVVDNFNTVLTTVVDRKDQVSSVVDQFQKLISQFANQAEPIGEIVDHLEHATTTAGALLGEARPDVRSTVTELNRTATQLNMGKADINRVFSQLPEAYQRLGRMGAYGSFFQLYACKATLRLTDPIGETVDVPLLNQTDGRCAP